MQRDEQCESDAKDDQRNEEVTVGEDAFCGFYQRHRNPIDLRYGLAQTYRARLGAVNAVQTLAWRIQEY